MTLDANIQNQAPALCYIRKQQGTSLHGISISDNWRNSRALTQSSGFFHGVHENAKHGHHAAGCVGASKDAPVPIAGMLTRHSLPPLISIEGGGLLTCQLEATMPKTTTPKSGTTEATNRPPHPRHQTPGTSHPERIAHLPSPSKSIDFSSRLMMIEASLTQARNHLLSGSLTRSLGSTLSASRHLKQAVTAATSSRAAS